MKTILAVNYTGTIKRWSWTLVSLGADRTYDEIESLGCFKTKWQALQTGNAFAEEHNFELCAARVGGEMIAGTAYAYFCGCNRGISIGVGFITPKSTNTELLVKCSKCGFPVKQEEVK